MIPIAIQTRPFKSSCASVLVLTFTWMWLSSNSRILRQWNQCCGETAPSAGWFVSLFRVWRLCLGISFTGDCQVNDIIKYRFQCNPSLLLHRLHQVFKLHSLLLPILEVTGCWPPFVTKPEWQLGDNYSEVGWVIQFLQMLDIWTAFCCNSLLGLLHRLAMPAHLPPLWCSISVLYGHMLW